MTQTVLVTGGAGLIGSMSCKELVENGYDVISVDNYDRGDFFGEEGDTEKNVHQYLPDRNIKHYDMDILSDRFDEIVAEVDGVIHTAAQPSHPRSIDIPYKDFEVNLKGTIKLLETLRTQNEDASLVFTSTNKVYGEVPNYFSYEKSGERFEPVDDALRDGFDESLRIDQNKHTPFGVSKASADLYVQEYARMYGLTTGIFRLGCITGGAAQAVELHNWEPYFVKIALAEEELDIFGYEGYQVRDVLHAKDLATLFRLFLESPNSGEVYNVGGGRENSISLRESFSLIEDVTGKQIDYSYAPAREADHQWWITDLSKVKNHYPEWEITYGLYDVFDEIAESLSEELDVQIL